MDLFLGAKAAEGGSPKTITWYRMILARAVTAFGADHPVDRLTGPELRAWLVEIRTTLAPVSVAGYVRTLKVFGNWLHAEELAEAGALHALRKAKVPDKLIEPVPDDTLRRLLGLATVRDRAILLLLLDTGLRVSEAAVICGRTARSRSRARARRSGSPRSGRRPARRSSATSASEARVPRMRRSSSADAARSTGAGYSRSSNASRRALGSRAGAAPIRCATRSPGATS